MSSLTIHPRRNIGIFAHVDAGKTTTTEHILYESGRTRSLGSVDSGTAVTDWLDIEKERGISVRAATTSLVWKDTYINLVDTPGHVDFLSEVERSMRVMDGAVLIVSAAEGVQAQTELIWSALRKLRIPTVIYVNKMDRIGADPDQVLSDIHRYLSPSVTPVQRPVGREQEYSESVDLWSELVNEEDRHTVYESLAEQDEALLERYLEGETLLLPEWRQAATQAAQRGAWFPLLYGASSRGIGIHQLMDALIDYLPGPSGDPEAPVSGIVFKIERDKTMGRMAFVRLYQGAIRNRDNLFNHSQQIEEKVTQIRKVDGGRSEDAGLLQAGDIAAVCGMPNVRIGDVLGDPSGIPEEARLAVPLLTVQAHWANEADYPRTVQALQELSDEDPLLDVQWMQDERELHVKVMGPIQLEMLTSTLLSRYGLVVSFDQPSVIYRETPRQAGEGYIAYTMPKPCWAILRFAIEPGAKGSGLQYSAQVRSEDLLPQYQNEVARRVPEALQQGLYGWEVVDLKVTLIEGEHHVWHTHPLDFAVATPMGIMNGLASVGTSLLEPILQYRITVPEENGGRVMNDIVQMRGSFDAPELQGDRVILQGRVPLATSMEYPVTLRSLTKGRGTMATFFAGYEPCPEDVHAERTRRGVNPLDQSKYILSVRKALQG
ncbi:TetM/TetW/TetO/TetS family tetracycline resistance ribosomal protection protein [Paenibacillus sp. JX-17]|uniref:TetM/TetW/TetO/TetS family tetracycline resistance ribosomal protection protein n=1 Tax=Paenibacillus lacisoli TaxID=3064525 RepID=A0ABT9CJB0_9BACL|nr:TetM/TetW/TetO/TetS family tetracycline resistance ribosomal protection protein [Paenibacillus sp. JX-17]MDO7908022.1 TetM/TetW/TetO/TetS family tetracycline resistance ribosomal protection protein [Paenibacillus sp. JX-17]